ncbi:hypothetical protein ACWGK5_26640 [Rhodococcus qingshengii]|uniref:hypothetical protein n=1 Tax=Rhodococcus qingshengii TaxID=334542 RepID=UPI0035DB8EF6
MERDPTEAENNDVRGQELTSTSSEAAKNTSTDSSPQGPTRWDEPSVPRVVPQDRAKSSFDHSVSAGVRPRLARRVHLAVDLSGDPAGVRACRSDDLHHPFRSETDHMWLVGPQEPGSIRALAADGTWTLDTDEHTRPWVT